LLLCGIFTKVQKAGDRKKTEIIQVYTFYMPCLFSCLAPASGLILHQIYKDEKTSGYTGDK